MVHLAECFSDFLNETIPKRTQHLASLPPWISQSTSHLIKCLKTARRSYKDMHPKVLKLKSMLENCCGNDKIEYEQNLAAERSTGKLFKYFRAFQKSNIPILVFYKNEKAENDGDKAQLCPKFLHRFTYKLLKFMKLLRKSFSKLPNIRRN